MTTQPMTTAQLEQAIDMLVETIDEALVLVSDTLGLHNRVLLTLATREHMYVDPKDRYLLQVLNDAFKDAQKEADAANASKLRSP